jgi:CubicO group peptidase (beta-lactamase class C family)
MSKPVFAYAMLKLCEKGLIDLDTPLTKYTPERFLTGDPRLDKITARHVLSHSSGFRSDSEPLKISFEPGEKWQYSGEGYSYLQSVLTRLVGMPIDPYMKSNVLVPFGMASSGYVWNDFFEKHMARPHDAKGVPFANKKSNEADVARYASAGALLSTPTDYSKFLIEVLAPKPADQFRLSQKSLAEMVRPQISLHDSLGSSWGLGWRIFPSPTGDTIWHGGDNDGFHCVAAASLSSKSGYVVMTNGEDGAALIQELAVKILNPFLAASYPY